MPAPTKLRAGAEQPFAILEMLVGFRRSFHRQFVRNSDSAIGVAALNSIPQATITNLHGLFPKIGC
jgi:hypothetical protein